MPQNAILIVDDNPAMAETIADILSAKSYAVYIAFSGVEAMGIIKSAEIDILLTDVVMPDMDGVTLCRIAKKTNPRLICILMTAYADSDVIQQGVDEGARAVFPKPLDVDRLIDLLESIG